MTTITARIMHEQSTEILVLAGRSVHSTLQTEISELSAMLASCDAHLETVRSDRTSAEAALKQADQIVDRCLPAANGRFD